MLLQVMCPLAAEILETINRTGLPFKLDAITQGDGNCFARGITQQCKRDPVKEYLDANRRNVTTFMKLKKDVCEFMMRESEVPLIVTFKTEFEAR